MRKAQTSLELLLLIAAAIIVALLVGLVVKGISNDLLSEAPEICFYPDSRQCDTGLVAPGCEFGSQECFLTGVWGSQCVPPPGCGGATCTDGEVRQCTTALPGICRQGTQNCVGDVWEECTASYIPGELNEICTSQDDEDCDGLTGCADSDCDEHPDCDISNGEFVIVDNGTANSEIVYAVAEHDYPYPQAAATELAEIIERISGVSLQTLGDDSSGNYDIEIHIGKTNAVRSLMEFETPKVAFTPALEEYSDEAYSFATVEHGGTTYILIQANPEQWFNDGGINYGVRSFAEDYFNVRWFMPGDDPSQKGDYWSYYPQSDTIAIDAITENPEAGVAAVEPAFESRQISGIDDLGWFKKNKLNNGRYFNPALHNESNIHNNAPNAHIVFSNYAPQQTVKQYVEDYFSANPKRPGVSVGMNDNTNYSDVDYKNADPATKDTTKAVFTYTNEAAKASLAADKMVAQLSYQYTEDPSESPALEPNVIPYLTMDSSFWVDAETEAYQKARISGWAAKADNIGLYEYFYGAPMLLPRFDSAIVEESIQLFNDSVSGKKGFYAEGYPNWALDGFKNYIAAKLAWTPALNSQDLIDEFCGRMFGAARQDMKNYFTELESVWMDGTAEQRELLETPGTLRAKIEQLEFVTPQKINNLRGYLNDAKAKVAVGSYEEARIETIETQFEYLSVWAGMYHKLKELSEMDVESLADQELQNTVDEFVSMSGDITYRPDLQAIETLAGNTLRPRTAGQDYRELMELYDYDEAPLFWNAMELMDELIERGENDLAVDLLEMAQGAELGELSISETAGLNDLKIALVVRYLDRLGQTRKITVSGGDFEVDDIAELVGQGWNFSGGHLAYRAIEFDSERNSKYISLWGANIESGGSHYGYVQVAGSKEAGEYFYISTDMRIRQAEPINRRWPSDSQAGIQISGSEGQYDSAATRKYNRWFAHTRVLSSIQNLAKYMVFSKNQYDSQEGETPADSDIADYDNLELGIVSEEDIENLINSGNNFGDPEDADAKIEIVSLQPAGQANRAMFGSQFPLSERYFEEGSAIWDWDGYNNTGQITRKYYYNNSGEYCYPDFEDCCSFPQENFVEFGMKEKLEEGGITVIRAPMGLNATGYDWKLSVGPIEGRQKLDFGSGVTMTPYFGAGELFSACEEMNIKIDYLAAVKQPNNPNCGQPMTSEDLSDLVAFASCPFTQEVENSYGHIEGQINNGTFSLNRDSHDWKYWVALRNYYYDHASTYPLEYIEMGNEVSDTFNSITYCAGTGNFENVQYVGLTKEEYVELFDEYASAVKSTLSSCGQSPNSIKLGFDTHYRFGSWDAYDKLIELLKDNATNTPDFLIWHKYVMYGQEVQESDKEDFVKRKISANLTHQEEIDRLLGVIEKYFGKNSGITLALTEFNISDSYPVTSGWPEATLKEQIGLANSLGVATGTASLYSTLLKPENMMEFATFFSLAYYTRWQWDSPARNYNRSFGSTLSIVINPYDPYTILPFYKKRGPAQIQYYQERPNYLAIKQLSNNLKTSMLDTKIESPTFSNNGMPEFGKVRDYVPLEIKDLQGNPINASKLRARVSSYAPTAAEICSGESCNGYYGEIRVDDFGIYDEDSSTNLIVNSQGFEDGFSGWDGDTSGNNGLFSIASGNSAEGSSHLLVSFINEKNNPGEIKEIYQETQGAIDPNKKYNFYLKIASENFKLKVDETEIISSSRNNGNFESPSAIWAFPCPAFNSIVSGCETYGLNGHCAELKVQDGGCAHWARNMFNQEIRGGSPGDALFSLCQSMEQHGFIDAEINFSADVYSDSANAGNIKIELVEGTNMVSVTQSERNSAANSAERVSLAHTIESAHWPDICSGQSKLRVFLVNVKPDTASVWFDNAVLTNSVPDLERAPYVLLEAYDGEWKTVKKTYLTGESMFWQQSGAYGVPKADAIATYDAASKEINFHLINKDLSNDLVIGIELAGTLNSVLGCEDLDGASYLAQNEEPNILEVSLVSISPENCGIGLNEARNYMTVRIPKSTTRLVKAKLN